MRQTLASISKFNQDKTMIKQELLDIIACPKCKGPVQLNDEKNGLICQTCQLVYEIRDDIPIMLIDESVDYSSSTFHGKLTD